MDDLTQKIAQLEEKIKKLEAAATIPKPVEDAFRERLRLEVISAIATSNKSNTSESQSVNESGASSYTVLKNPDAFLQVNVNGTIYYLAAWT